jgi:hypothetical protein
MFGALYILTIFTGVNLIVTMKRNIFALLILSAFVACKSSNKPSDKDSVVNNNYQSHQSAALIKKFKPIVQGVWVKTSYIDKVVKTKSPAEAEDQATGLTTMYIETNNLKGDSIVVEVGWGNHEGGEITLKFSPGKTRETISFGSFDLGYSVKNGDTSIVLFEYDKEKNEHTTTWYTKALNKQSDLGDGMDYLINKGLFAGKYKLADSLGNNGSVVFTDRGKVSGLANFTSYFINDDVGGEPMNNLDHIIFDRFSKTSKSKSYSFKFVKDTLHLYSTKANSDSTELLVDKLIYKLVKQK